MSGDLQASVRRTQRAVRMVSNLHRLGYQRLRIIAYVHPLAWWIAIGPADRISERDARLPGFPVSRSSGRVCAIVAGILVSACTPAASHTTDLTGRVSVVDGDTLEMRGERIRLWGVDAFESRQLCQRPGGAYRCGQVAANALDGWLAGQVVSCEPVGRPDRYGRAIARCQVRGQDLGAWLVEGGHALDYQRYSQGRYAREQQRAQAAGRGAWAGEFEPPWEWRAR